MSTAHRLLDGFERTVNVNGTDKTVWIFNDIELHNKLLKTNNTEHPCSVWVRQSLEHYDWCYKYFLHCMTEHNIRTTYKNKYEHLIYALQNPPKKLTELGFTPPPHSKIPISTVESHRIFYVNNTNNPKWTNRTTPEWFNNKR